MIHFLNSTYGNIWMNEWNIWVEFVYKYKLLWDNAPFNTWFFWCIVSSIYTLLFYIWGELNIIIYYSFLTLFSNLCLTLSKYFPKCIIWSLFVQFTIFLCASSSFIHNHFLFIIFSPPLGQLNSMCLTSSLSLLSGHVPFSYHLLIPLRFQTPAFIQANPVVIFEIARQCRGVGPLLLCTHQTPGFVSRPRDQLSWQEIEAEAHLNIIKKNSSYLKENNTSPLQRKWSLYILRIIRNNTLCGQNTELMIIKAGGTYSYHWALKGNVGHCHFLPHPSQTTVRNEPNLFLVHHYIK
jgi:hypothetical protein